MGRQLMCSILAGGVLISCLPTVSGSQTLDSLVEQLQSGKPSEKEAAAWKIGDLGKAAASAVPALVASLKDDNEIVRRGAAKSLGQIGDRRAVPALIDAARLGHVNASWALKNGGFSFTPSEVQGLVATLNESKDAYIQMNLVVAIGRAQGKTAIQPFIALLKSGDEYVRKNAAISMGLNENPAAVDPLLAIVKSVHGLVDGLYLREMAAKIRRGLAGQLTRGYATGGCTYGYRTVPIPDQNRAGEKIGCRIEINDEEAAVVRQVFSWYAAGVPLPTIVSRLSQQGAPTPRGGNKRGAWRVGAVRRMLANERYRGRQIWGQRRTERRPGSRAKVQRPVAPSEWHVVDRPELRIIDEELWTGVQTRRQQIAALASNHRQAGRTLLRGKHQIFHGRYIFGGLMSCGVCGKMIGVVSNHIVKGVNYRYLGCAHAMRNGVTACSNRINVRADVAERMLLAGLQAELLRPDTLAYVTDQLAIALRATVDQRPVKRAELLRRQNEIRTKIGNLLTVVESGAAPSTVLAALRERETEAHRLEEELAALDRPIDEGRLSVMPSWVKQQLGDLAGLLQERSDHARSEFKRMGLRVYV